MAAPLKRCLLRRRDGREQHGVAASCLRELRDKGEGPPWPGRPLSPLASRAPLREVAGLGPIRAAGQAEGGQVPGGSEGRWE